MAYCNLDGRLSKDLFAGISTRTFWGEKMLIARVELLPQAVATAHSHPHEQAIIVLAGELDLAVTGEETRTLRTGDMYIIPGDVVHEARAGIEGCSTVEVFSPVRETLQY